MPVWGCIAHPGWTQHRARCSPQPALPPSKTGQDMASVTMKNDSVSKSQSRMAGHAIPCRRHCARHSGMGLSRQLWLTTNTCHSILCLCNGTQRAIRVDSSSRSKSRQAWRKDARMERLRSKVWYKRTICSDSPWVATAPRTGRRTPSPAKGFAKGRRGWPRGSCQVDSDLFSGGPLDCGRWSHQWACKCGHQSPSAQYLLERTRIQEADMSMHLMVDLWFGSFEPKWLR